MPRAICEDCGSLVEAELTHNGICAVGHYVHCGWGHELSPDDLISDDVAEIISKLEAKLAEGDGLVERHADKERNVLLNTALSDLDSIINGHDPEVDTSLNNLVWDRLDKLAVAIEAKAADRIEQLVATNEALKAQVADHEKAAQENDPSNLWRFWANKAQEMADNNAAARQDAKDAEAYAEELENEAVLSKAAYEGVSSLLLSVQQDCIKERQRAERLEAKLAKAVEALRSTLNFIENTEGEMGVILGCGDKARATLAEIKLQSSEFATQKGESHE